VPMTGEELFWDLVEPMYADPAVLRSTMMGLPCVFDPLMFLEKSRAGAWVSWSFAIFWAIRLYFQWFVYKADLWRGKRMETWMHWWFAFIWLALAIFAIDGFLRARRAPVPSASLSPAPATR